VRIVSKRYVTNVEDFIVLTYFTLIRNSSPMSPVKSREDDETTPPSLLNDTFDVDKMR
jgi:hypothetical protein